MGSLKDVEEVKGKTSLKKLNNFLKEKNIDYCPFSSNINSWLLAHKKILGQLKNSKLI